MKKKTLINSKKKLKCRCITCDKLFKQKRMKVIDYYGQRHRYGYSFICKKCKKGDIKKHD